VRESTVTVLPEILDQDAVAIGICLREGTERWIEAGRLLKAKKNELGHGSFIAWIELNAKALGFSSRSTAARLMSAADSVNANVALTQHFDLGVLWGNKSTEEKAERRAAREQSLGAKQTALPNKKYGVILADPEWRFEPWSRETGMARAADNHYPTSGTEIIAARNVPSIAADDCVLFLWATAPMLPQALYVMAAWGFDYKTHCIWDKLIAGTGYWFRSRHELLLIGTKGKIPAPAMGEQGHSIISAQKGGHSAKPEVFWRLIEIYFPTLPKIELNRRGPPRNGWDAWGLEAEQTTESAGANPAPEPAPVLAPQPPGAGSPSFDERSQS